MDVAASGIQRSGTWHEFTIIDTSQSLSLMIDGTTVYTRAGTGGTPLDHIAYEHVGDLIGGQLGSPTSMISPSRRLPPSRSRPVSSSRASLSSLFSAPSGIVAGDERRLKCPKGCDPLGALQPVVGDDKRSQRRSDGSKKVRRVQEGQRYKKVNGSKITGPRGSGRVPRGSEPNGTS